MFHNCSLLKIKNGGDDWDRTNCDVSRKIYSLLPYHYGGISKILAPQPGIEPGTNRLTVYCSTAELSGNKNYGLGRKNRTSVSWSQTTNSAIKLHREWTDNLSHCTPSVKEILVEMIGIEPIVTKSEDLQSPAIPLRRHLHDWYSVPDSNRCECRERALS